MTQQYKEVNIIHVLEQWFLLMGTQHRSIDICENSRSFNFVLFLILDDVLLGENGDKY